MPPTTPSPGRRILVIGTSGAGKTHVAEALARILDIPYICNDAIIWRPNWQETPKDEVFAEFDAATSAPAWTLDGNLAGSHPEDRLVLSRCDTIVWLDLPRWQVWSAITRRTLWRAITRKSYWHGNVERWRNVFSHDSMIWWSIKTFPRRRRNYTALFADPTHGGKTRVRLTSRRRVNAWLASLPPPNAESLDPARAVI
ncbi:MAG: adenylate kinase [Dehalococcoidia bacterium]|nr:adenylate kinase [Dehalococcoidia bacterium]